MSAKQKYGDDLFEGTAYWYARYRLPYAQELSPHLIQQFGLNTQSRVLDLGCGTGLMTFPLAPHVHEIVAVDPDTEMLHEARCIADEQNVTNIIWKQGRAEDVDSSYGTFTLVTIGTAFHWMDQELVLQYIHPTIAKGGGVTIVTNWWNFWKDNGKPHTVPWKKKRIEIIQRYLGDKRRAGKGIAHLDTGERFESLLARSAFRRFQTWTFERSHIYDIESLLGILYSTSFGRRAYFGKRLEAFEQDFRQEMLAVEPSGTFADTITTQALLAWK